MPSMEMTRRTVHRDALPVDKTLTVRAARLLRVTVGTAPNRMVLSSMLTTDPVGIPIDDMEELTRKMKSHLLCLNWKKPIRDLYGFPSIC